VCPSCHAEVDCAGGKAEVLAKHAEVESVATTLRTGDEGKIAGSTWTVIGLSCHKELDTDEPSSWVEYLLFNAKLGLMWLVEASDEWSRVKVLDDWPEPDGTSQRFVGDVYNKLYDYGGEITYAAGNFNWQVQVGDRVSITDYAYGEKRLSQEKSDDEITWSLAQPVDAAEVLKWFGKSDSDEVAPTATADSPDSKAAHGAGKLPTFAAGWPMWTAWTMLVLFNFNLLFNEEDFLSFVICGLAAWLVYMPVQIARKFGHGSQA
jgi:hypothetical protein